MTSCRGGRRPACRRAAASRPAETTARPSSTLPLVERQSNLQARFGSAGCRPAVAAGVPPAVEQATPFGGSGFMEETGEGSLFAPGARRRQAHRSADLQSALGERPPVMNALEPDRRISYAYARPKPVKDPAVAKGFGGQGRRSAPNGHRQFLWSASVPPTGPASAPWFAEPT